MPMPVLAEQGWHRGIDADDILDLGLGVVGVGLGRSILLSTGSTFDTGSSAV